MIRHDTIKLFARAFIALLYLINFRMFATYTVIMRNRRLHDNFNGITNMPTVPISKRFGATRRTGVQIRNPVGREDERRNEDHFVALINQLFRFALRGCAGTYEDLGNLIART